MVLLLDLKNDLDFLKRLAKGIASQMGENCEVAIHDLTTDYEHTIIAIENGHVSGRKLGDGASKLVIEALRSKDGIEDKYNYFTRTTDGRELKSTSIFIPGTSNKPIAVLSINYDISQLKMAEKTIREIVSTTEDDSLPTISNNVIDLLDVLIEEAYQIAGKPVAMMTREDKAKSIKYLEQRGALLIKKSGDKISKFFDISKYTLYGYLSSDDDE